MEKLYKLFLDFEKRFSIESIIVLSKLHSTCQDNLHGKEAILNSWNSDGKVV